MKKNEQHSGSQGPSELQRWSKPLKPIPNRRTLLSTTEVGQPLSFDGSDCTILHWVRGVVGFCPGTRVQALLGPLTTITTTSINNKHLSLMKVIREIVDFKYDQDEHNSGIKTILFDILYETIICRTQGCHLDFVVHHEPGFVEMLKHNVYTYNLRLAAEKFVEGEVVSSHATFVLTAHKHQTIEIEGLRPYSPTDHLEPLSIDDSNEQSSTADVIESCGDNKTLNDSVCTDTTGDTSPSWRGRCRVPL